MSHDSGIDAVVATIREELATLHPGDRLPSSRELMRRHMASPVTVARAVAMLAAEGVVVTRPGSGTFVAAARGSEPDRPRDTSWQSVALAGRDVVTGPDTEPLVHPSPDTVVMSGGYLSRSLQPVRALSAALARAARRPDAWDRAPRAGISSLRAILAQSVRDAGPGDVLITSGGQAALSMLFRAVLPPGSPLLVESPTYPGALAAARAAGLRLVPVPLDDDGVRPDLLAEAFARTGARLFYCQPTFHNPTGTVLATARREQVLDVVRAYGAFVVEDDFARLLSHGGPAPRPLIDDDRDGAVLYVTSLTKPASPSLRIGAVIGRGPVMERLRSLRHVDDFFVARPLQEAAVELLSSPSWQRHVRALARSLRHRSGMLAEALGREIPEWRITRLPPGGLHLWVRTDADAEAVVEGARSRRVTVDSGRRYFAAEPPADHLRLNFAAVDEVTDLVEGARRLTAVRR